jgi:hypothetical protein
MPNLTYFEKVAQFNKEQRHQELNEMLATSTPYDFSKVEYIELDKDYQNRVFAKFDTGCSTRFRSKKYSMKSIRQF